MSDFFPDYALVEYLAKLHRTRAIVVNGEVGTAIFTTLDGDERDIIEHGASCLPRGVFKLVTRRGVALGNMVEIPLELVIRQLTDAGLITPDTRH